MASKELASLTSRLCLLASLIAFGCSGVAAIPAVDSGSQEGFVDASSGPLCVAQTTHTGEATYYDADGSGNCSFAPGSDRLVAALNSADYNGSAACGGCVQVYGPDGSVVVRIVDRCPGCSDGDIDLSREAFELVSPLAAGRIDVSWDYVACPGDALLEVHFKDGSNGYWTALQIRGHRYPIATLEASSATRPWHTIERLNYNYFVDSDGLGDGPYQLQIHDIHGSVIEMRDVTPGDDLLVSTTEQFPVCE